MVSDNLLQRVQSLMRMHESGLLGGETMPEDALIGVVPEEELANVLTLAMALNYQRNSYTLWQSVQEAYRDEDFRWIFQPHLAANCDLDDLRNALLRHRVALQPNRHPEIWQRVAKGIVKSSARGDVLGLIQSASHDIAELKRIVQATRKSEFPYLSGPKIFNYWLYVMEMYVGIRWKSRELLTIAPDTHIIKASVQLGLCSEAVLQGTENDRHLVANAWETALRGSGLAPIDVHTSLWLWSRAGFPAIVESKS